MDDRKWLEFLDRIATEKKLTSTQKITLKAKFPTFEGMANDRDLTEKFDLTDTGWKKRLGNLYKIFGIEGDGNDKATPLQEHLQRESLNWQCKQEQNSIDTPPIPKPTTPTPPQIDWLDRSSQLLETQKHPTTNNFFGENKRNLDDIHVPLALVERKERPKVKEEPSPEHGSQLYQPEYTEVDRFEHDKFLTRVVEKPAGVKHIAIIGEPGAGKTTILTKIGERLIQQAKQRPEEPLVVAWISLASLSAEQELSDYFYTSWIKSAHPARLLRADWQDELVKLVEQKRVWLLLDGLDEISKPDSLIWLRGQLDGWGQNLRVVVTCRLNQWEATAGGNALTNIFDVYRTLDYSYRTSQGDDQVKEFISKWFADNEKVATQIRTELDAPGKERIKDLVKNPLRLTLLCASWEKDNQALPETQADLYRGFVNYLYKWKAAEFKDEVKLRQELDLALGKLAKAGLNRAPINDGAVRRFRFTASEISKLWTNLPDTLLPAAKNLGWLNVVGEESGEDVYAFYHPTFQEYFAACSIDDWDYFLPRGHIDRPVLCKSGENLYRVFEQEWQQVILLWMGRKNEDIADNIKEEFIDKLIHFKEQENEFYYFSAYGIAATLISEFKSSQQAQYIVLQLVNWSFGYFNVDKQKWEVFSDPIKSFTLEKILSTHKGYAIEALTKLLERDDLSDDVADWLRCLVAETLGKIDAGNSKAIITLTTLLGRDNLEDRLRERVIFTWRTIGVGNQDAVNTLIQFLKHNYLSPTIGLNVVDVLSTIGVGNQEVIDTLIQLLGQSDVDLLLYNLIAEVLGEIGVENEKAIDNLVQILQCDKPLHLLRLSAQVLSKIGIGNKKAIDALAKFNESAIDIVVKLLSEDTLNDDFCFFVNEALKTIDVGNRRAIVTLEEFLSKSLSDKLCACVAKGLGTIDVGNSKAIAALEKLLSESLPDELCTYVAEVLGTIDMGNSKAIAALEELLSKSLSDEIRVISAYSLIKVGVRNQDFVTNLIWLAKQESTTDYFLVHILDLLEKIGLGNEEAIFYIVNFLVERGNTSNYFLDMANVLKKIITKKTMPSVIENLKNYTTTEVYKSNLKKSKSCHEILWQCAQTLSYPKFHTAWHQIDPNHLAHHHR